MAWRGFLTESKEYLGYPRNRWAFWLGFPKAAVRFYALCTYDWLMQMRKATILWWREWHG